MDPYRDRWIECTAEEIRVRGYYFPWGTKRIPYTSIKGMERFSTSAMRGRLRIWGTSNPRYWASLDPGRPRKSVGFTLDLGRAVRPFLTPEDPDAFESAVRAHAALPPSTGTSGPPLL